MAWAQVAVCGVCGQIKKEANKWMMYRHIHGAYLPEISRNAAARLELYLWDEAISHIEGVELLCSDTCLQKVMAKFREY